MNNSTLDFNKLIRESFWDYNITEEDILEIAQSNDFREKKHLFEKVLFFSTDRVRNIKSIFKKDDLEELFDSVSINQFNSFAERNILIAKYFLLDKNIRVKGLEWKKI